MAETLNLPQNVKPLWIEGLFTSEYERDTLPLLFAADKVYQDYYTALRTKNPNLSVAIDQIRERNNLARLERQDGMWMECVDSLAYCVNLRKAVFDETDFQYTAAQKHHIMSLLNFATFFLRESNGKTREPMLMRSFELFKKAEESVAHVRGREDRAFLKTAIENNYSVYFAKRKKYCAAAQRMMLAVRAWLPLQIKEHQFYFAVQKSSGDLWSGRVDDAVIGLKQATTLYSKRKMEKAASPQRQRTEQEYSDDSDEALSSDDEDGRGAGQMQAQGSGNTAAPFRYKIHVLNSGLDADIASCIAVHHNLAIALIAQRRYKEAVGWVIKALEIASAQSALLTATHPIVVAIRHAEEFCNKMSLGSKMSLFKMKKDEHSSQQHREMQAAVLKTRDVAPKPPGGRGNSAQPPRFRKPSHVEAIQTYIKNISTRRLVEEYGFEDPRKSRSKSPPKRDMSSSPPRSTRPTSSPQREGPRVKQDERSSAPSAEPSPARAASSRSNTPASSRSSRTPSPPSSRASSRSPSHSPIRPAAAAAEEEHSSPSPPPAVAEDPPRQEEESGPTPVDIQPTETAPVTVEATEVTPDRVEGEQATSAASDAPAEPSQEPPATTEDTENTHASDAAAEAALERPEPAAEESERPATPPAQPADATYGADGFESASEAGSPVKAAIDPPLAEEPASATEPLDSATEVAPQPASSEEAQDKRLETTYGDEGFESASEAGSPQKAKPAEYEAAAAAASPPTSVEDNSTVAVPAPVVAPPTAAEGNLGATRASTSYEDDGFEASEAGSPEKKPADASRAQDYTMDFDATADSNFSPPPPKRQESNEDESSAAQQNPEGDAPAGGSDETLNTSEVERVLPGADTTYGDGEFDTDTSA